MPKAKANAPTPLAEAILRALHDPLVDPSARMAELLLDGLDPSLGAAQARSAEPDRLPGAGRGPLASWDTNADGDLSKEELVAALSQMGPEAQADLQAQAALLEARLKSQPGLTRAFYALGGITCLAVAWLFFRAASGAPLGQDSELQLAGVMGLAMAVGVALAAWRNRSFAAGRRALVGAMLRASNPLGLGLGDRLLATQVRVFLAPTTEGYGLSLAPDAGPPFFVNRLGKEAWQSGPLGELLHKPRRLVGALRPLAQAQRLAVVAALVQAQRRLWAARLLYQFSCALGMTVLMGLAIALLSHTGFWYGSWIPSNPGALAILGPLVGAAALASGLSFGLTWLVLRWVRARFAKAVLEALGG